MKFVVARQDLVDVIAQLQNVVAQRPALPLLANFLLEAGKDELIFTATDLTVGVRCFAPAKVLASGATTLPAKRFFQLIREIAAHQVEISTLENDVAEIRAGHSRFRLHGMSRAEYPQLPGFAGATQVKISQGQLRELFYKTAFAVSREESRFALTGILVQLAEGSITVVGTDGRRLAKAELLHALDNNKLSGRYIIPLKAVDEMNRVLRDSDEEAILSLMSERVCLETGSVSIITKLLAGEYPDYQRVIPQKSDVQISVHREELIGLLRQVSLFTSENAQSVRFAFGEAELTLTANNPEIGEGRASMPVDYQGPRFDIAFNPHFFIDILRHSVDETVSLLLSDRYSPGAVRDSSSALFVLMPMRINEE